MPSLSERLAALRQQTAMRVARESGGMTDEDWFNANANRRFRVRVALDYEQDTFFKKNTTQKRPEYSAVISVVQRIAPRWYWVQSCMADPTVLEHFNTDANAEHLARNIDKSGFFSTGFYLQIGE